MRIDEINTRLSEIVKEIDEASGDSLTALEEEVRSLKAERDQIKADIESRKNLREAVAGEKIEAEEIEKPTEEKKMENTIYTRDSAEYRSAWLKTLQGVELNEAETRAYAQTGSAIPTAVADVFFAKMKKLAPMLSEITLMNVSGNLKFFAQGTVNDATKHTENASLSASADTVVSVTLGAFEFMKIIGISKSASAMSVDAFEAFLVDMLAEDIARKIDDYIINDSTNGIVGITYTAGTNAIIDSTNGITYSNICKLIALLPAGYDAEAKFLVNKATLWGKIANIVDSSGNPIFIPSTVEGFQGRILGYPVLVDDYVSTSHDELFLGAWKNVVGNLSEGIKVERDESSGFTYGTINYRGYAAFDSAVANKEAIVKLAKA